MARSEYYSGNVEALQRVLRNLSIGDERLSTITETDFEAWQEWADDYIDDELAEYYSTPFHKVTTPSGDRFPGMVVTAARYLVASYMGSSQYFQNDPNMSESARVWMSRAFSAINRMKDRVRISQRHMRSPHLFIPGAIRPMSTEELTEDFG